MNTDLLRLWDGQPEDVQAALSKRKNRRLAEYVAFLEAKVESGSREMNTAEDDLGMNNQILNVNFEMLVKIQSEMEKIVHRLTESLSRQEQTVSDVSAVSTRLGQSLQAETKNMLDQSASLEEFSSVLEQMSASIQAVSKNAREAEEIVHELSTSAENTNDAIAETMQSIGGIKDASGQIEEITTLLVGIADQTDLLAMNAAIEAAHAGESGKGFAVVAEEMRKLANTSREEADKIINITRTIVDSIDEASERTENVIAGNRIVTDKVKSANELTTEISGAMQEQASGTDQIVKETRSLMDGTSHLKEAIQTQEADGEELVAAVENLRKVHADVQAVAESEQANYLEIVDIANKLGRCFVKNLEIGINLQNGR